MALRKVSHYDLSIVPLIHQIPCANGFVSLQAKISGETVDLPVVLGSIVVLCSTVATIVSQGALPAAKHHVAGPPAHLQVESGAFTFLGPDARSYGLNVIVTGETATFGDWIGTNYQERQRLAYFVDQL